MSPPDTAAASEAAVAAASRVADPHLAGLKRRALSLGSANAIDYGLQFLLPIVLARALPPEAFGEYRLMWLAIMTAMLLVPMQMPNVLNFFLPRADAPTRRLHVHQTLLWLAGAGLLAAFAVSPLNPLLPARLDDLNHHGFLLPALTLVYALSLLLDTLPTVEERVVWQASATVGLSLLRTVTLASVALLTHDLYLVLAMLLWMLLVKFAVLLMYIVRYHGLGGAWFDGKRFAMQMSHAAPLGFAGALFGLRLQSDQWVAAHQFSLTAFAAFSIAAIFGPLINLFRISVNHAYLPSMSRLHAASDIPAMLELNSRANATVAAMVYPLLAFGFVFAEELIALAYTQPYAIAAPALRVYVIGMIVLIVEQSSIMLLLREGNFVLRLSLLLVLGAASLSWLGAQHLGLAGAALGSTCALFVDRWLTLRRVAGLTHIPLRRLQNWGLLLRLLLAAVCAATLAWLVADLLPHGIAIQLLAGGGVLAAVYLLLLTVWRVPPWQQRGRGRAA